MHWPPVALAFALGLAGFAWVYSAHASPTPAQAARTLNVTDEAHLHLTGTSGEQLEEEGPTTGALPGKARAQFLVGSAVNGSFTFYPRGGGSITGHRHHRQLQRQPVRQPRHRPLRPRTRKRRLRRHGQPPHRRLDHQDHRPALILTVGEGTRTSDLARRPPSRPCGDRRRLAAIDARNAEAAWVALSLRIAFCRPCRGAYINSQITRLRQSLLSSRYFQRKNIYQLSGSC